jgi:hypothetical protein
MHALSHWLCPAGGLPDRTNHARLQLYASRLGEARGTRVYDTNIPDDQFQAALTRAARHAGYSMTKDAQHKAYLVRDLTLEDRGKGELRLSHERTLRAEELPGAPIVVSWLHRTRPPMSAFPCGALLHDVRYVRSIRLRVHSRAQLVFEVHRGADHPAGTVVRTIRVEVDLGGDARALARDLADVSRTVENTVQIVLMGARPRGRYGA